MEEDQEETPVTESDSDGPEAADPVSVEAVARYSRVRFPNPLKRHRGKNMFTQSWMFNIQFTGIRYKRLKMMQYLRPAWCGAAGLLSHVRISGRTRHRKKDRRYKDSVHK